MFGKNKEDKQKEQPQPPVVINPNEQPVNPLEIPGIPEQPLSAPGMLPQAIQESQQLQQPQQPVEQQVQPVQPTQQQQPQAMITEAVVAAPGVFKYVVETNYPLTLGYCSLTQ